MNSEQYFCPCPRQKTVEFSAHSADLVNVKDVLLRSRKYAVRVVGVGKILLHCNASNLVLENLKSDKI